MKCRLKFAKLDDIKFIGHLDLMRVFQKAIRRAGIPIAYSEGYNPHQLLTFPQPLALGTTSEGEYIEMQLTKDMDIQILCRQLNEQMPWGVQLLGGIILKEDSPKGMAVVRGATYELIYSVNFFDANDISVIIKEFLQQTEILFEKQGKSKNTMVNIRDGIYSMEGIKHENIIRFKLFIATGSKQNIRPEWVIEKFFEFCGQPFILSKVQIHRTDLFTQKEGQWISLEDFIE